MSFLRRNHPIMIPIDWSNRRSKPIESRCKFEKGETAIGADRLRASP
jgi:hypothetical protein